MLSSLPAGGGRGPRGAVWRVLGASDEGAHPTAAGPDGADGAVDPPQVLLTGCVSGNEWGRIVCGSQLLQELLPVEM